MPVGMIFPPIFFISCVVIHNNMTLKPIIWWFFFIFSLKIKKKFPEWSLKCACRSAAFSGTECPLKGHWTVPEIRISVNIPWAFSGHSEMFQLTERRIFIMWFDKYKGLFYLLIISSIGKKLRLLWILQKSVMWKQLVCLTKIHQEN